MPKITLDDARHGWKDVPRWEGIYEAHPRGLIRRKETGRLLRFTTAGAGYKCVRFSALPRRERPYVHRVMLETFLRPARKNEEADHRNHDKTDNRLTNLRWITHQENCARRLSHGGPYAKNIA